MSCPTLQLRAEVLDKRRDTKQGEDDDDEVINHHSHHHPGRHHGHVHHHVTPSHRRLRWAQFRRLGAAVPRDAGEFGALEHQRVDCDNQRASRHGERGNLGTEQDGIQDAGGQWESNDIVPDCPPQVLVHLAQGGMGQLDSADDVEPT